MYKFGELILNKIQMQIDATTALPQTL